MNLSESKKVYDYLRYVYNLTQERTDVKKINLEQYAKVTGVNSKILNVVYNNHLSVKDGKAKWIASEPTIKMANSIIEKVKTTTVKKTHKNWTKEEENELEDMIKEGLTNSQIADKLGRTHSSVKMKRTQMSVTPRVWTEEEEDILMRLYNNNLRYKEIAKKLDRTEKAIEQRIYLIKNRYKNTKKLSDLPITNKIENDVIEYSVNNEDKLHDKIDELTIKNTILVKKIEIQEEELKALKKDKITIDKSELRKYTQTVVMFIVGLLVGMLVYWIK